jgi:hypothetical protein
MASGLSREQRRAQLAEEMGEGDGEVNETSEPVVVTPSPIVEPVQTPAPAPPVSLTPDLAALMQALVTGITQANVGTAQVIRDALSNAATMAREPLPEIKTIAGHSVYAHPLGEAHNTKLRCPMFLGIYDEEGKCKPALEIFEDTCTEKERVELNKIEPGLYPGIERNDGTTATWRVVQQQDDNGQPTRLIIAVPQMWLSQAEYQQMPGQPNFLRQLNAARETAAA